MGCDIFGSAGCLTAGNTITLYLHMLPSLIACCQPAKKLRLLHAISQITTVSSFHAFAGECIPSKRHSDSSMAQCTITPQRGYAKFNNIKYLCYASCEALEHVMMRIDLQHYVWLDRRLQELSCPVGPGHQADGVSSTMASDPSCKSDNAF